MKTKYSDFRKFILTRYENIDLHKFVLPEVHELPDGDQIPDEESAVRILFQMLEKMYYDLEEEYLWCDFEDDLGNLDYDEYFSLFTYDDEKPFVQGYQHEDVASDLKICVSFIKKLFSYWIDTIELKKPLKKYYKIFSDDDIFLTFNYTETLEKLYDINPENICHIHGVKGEEIIVGHGEEYNGYESIKFAGMSGCILSQLHEILRKDVNKAYSNNYNFFKNLENRNITDIYCIGFSLSTIDEYYIQEICSILDTKNIVLHFTKYDRSNKSDILKLEKFINCGFKGKMGKGY